MPVRFAIAWYAKFLVLNERATYLLGGGEATVGFWGALRFGESESKCLALQHTLDEEDPRRVTPYAF
eukprot:9302176-Prorocentrum_lima.AAC.1